MRAQNDRHRDDGSKVGDRPAARCPSGEINHASSEDDDEDVSSRFDQHCIFFY